MSNLVTRILTAIVMVAVLLTALFLLPDPAAIYLFGVVILIAGWEWSGFVGRTVAGIKWVFLALLATFAFVPQLLFPMETLAAYFIYMGVVCWLIFTLMLIGKSPVSGFFQTILAGLLTLLPAWYAF